MRSLLGSPVHPGGTAEEIVAAEEATVRGELVDRPFVLVGQHRF